jgi:hypothetical protein
MASWPLEGILRFFNSNCLDIIRKGMQGRLAHGKDTFVHFINLHQKIRLQFFKLGMQFKKNFSTVMFQ